ncbi:DUF429 domain-containing protein [Subtercola sp. YIM 133946]|uniref:DUF429 domain-containing protein n=1 Tax=Subtercola sp. YIM 133946 TaxID=3118909 RepID=UPI002F92A4F2
MPVITAGVDLAAEAKGTALAVIEWRGATAVLRDLQLGVADETIVSAAAGSAKLGIDCALGWPDEFVAFVAAHASGDPLPDGADGSIDWRRTLAYRATDREVRAVTGRWPLSVSTDRLGLTAMRCAGLLGRLRASGVDVDRSGAGRIAEVYPAASLRLWGFVTAGYRADSARRGELVADLRSAAPWLDLGGFAPLMRASTDAFDAVIASLATRAAALGHSTVAPPGMLAQARREGWVALPTCPLAALVDTVGRAHP